MRFTNKPDKTNIFDNEMFFKLRKKLNYKQFCNVVENMHCKDCKLNFCHSCKVNGLVSAYYEYISKTELCPDCELAGTCRCSLNYQKNNISYFNSVGDKLTRDKCNKVKHFYRFNDYAPKRIVDNNDKLLFEFKYDNRNVLVSYNGSEFEKISNYETKQL